MRFTNLWSRAVRGLNKKTSSRRFVPTLSRLEDRFVPNGYIAAGAGYGAPPLVAIRVDKTDALNQGGLGNVPPGGGTLGQTSDGQTDFTSDIFDAYNPRFIGGVSVATGNFDGDYTTPDWLVTGAGPGGGPDVIVWRTAQDSQGDITVTGKIAEFYAFDPRFTGGVNVAAGDLDGDGRAELIVSAKAGGGPEVKVYKFGTDGQFHQSLAFYAYAANFTGGVTVASGQGYDTPFQVEQVMSAQVPNNVAITTPYNPASSRPGLNTTNAAQDFPLMGGIGVLDTQDPTDPNPGPSETPDPAHPGENLPYFTVASGVIQYDSANLLNSYGNYAYTPNVFDPIDPTFPQDPPFNDPLVFASWSAMSMSPPDFAYAPSINYGPFVETEPSLGSGPPTITRFVAPNGQVTAQNQLILGAGPGGGPHVRVLSISSDGTQYGLQINNSNDFYAFDKNYTGGVNVAIGSFVSLPVPGNGTVTLNGTSYPVITPNLTSPLLTQSQFPYSTQDYTQYQAQILVTAMSGGQSAVWADYNPSHAVRNNVTQLNLVPAFLSTQLVFNKNSALSGFYTEQDTTAFPDAIDPEFTGNIMDGVSALTFDATNLFSSMAASARAQTVFAAGASKAPSRGPEVKIFDNIGPTAAVVAGPLGNNSQTDPVDQFAAFTSGSFPTGLGGIAFGFGALPAPTRDIVQLAPITIPTLTDPHLV